MTVNPVNRSAVNTASLDSPVPKYKLEAKRASFQTEAIGGFSIDDTKEDDDFEGNKLLWKRMFERKVTKRVLKLQEQKTILLKKCKHEKAVLEKKIPLDLLTKEWFNENQLTVQTRLYLLEKLLPTLILGLEKLLMEVEKNHLTVLATPHPYFNPINFLAQYLMENNPQYNRPANENPYIHGLKHVVEQLNSHVVDIKYSRLSTLKAETKLRQSKREQLNKVYLDKQEKKKESLRLKFRDWMLSTNGNVMLSLAQHVLRSFSESFPDYLFETFEDVKYDKELEEIDTKEQILNEDEFAEYMYSYVKSLSDNPFQDFLEYLSHSSDFFRQKREGDWWRKQFAELFLACDIGKAGYLNRNRVIMLFEEFYDYSLGTKGAEFRNPRQWPVIELDEMEGREFIRDLGKDYSNTDAPASIHNENNSEIPYYGVERHVETEKFYPGEGRDIKSKQSARFSLTADTGDLISDKSSYSGIPDEYSAATNKFPELASIISDIQRRGHTLITTPFDRNSLTIRQFVQLMETFMGNTTDPSAIESLLNYIHYEYRETKEEKIEKLTQANREALAALHRLVLEALFEKWDNDVSGYLNLRELVEVLSNYKDGMEKNAIKRAHKKLKFFRKDYANNPTLSKTEFAAYIETIAAEISDNEADFDSLVTFLTVRNEDSCMERTRRTARRRWLHAIQRAAETSSSSLEFVYKSVFQTLYKDAEAHGDNKKISSSIALLRHNNHRPERGEYFLHYVACTLEDAPYVLNQALYRDTGVSFGAVDDGKPLHIVKVQDHGRVHIWNCHRDKIDGSFVVVPLKDQHNRVFGVLGIDTLRDHCDKYFTSHEINFYQGVAKAFSIAYHHVRVRNDILKVVDNAVLWLFNETPNINAVITYLAEPSGSKDYVLCKTMTTEYEFDEPWSEVHVPPVTLQKEDSYFRIYLFRCADTSEVIFAETYKARHICVPVWDLTGRALAVLDINLDLRKQLLAHEHKGLLLMLKILHEACNTILKEAAGAPQLWILADRDNEERRAKLLFHQKMLQELKENINDLSDKSLAEFRKSKRPPLMAHDVFRVVLHILQPKLDVENITWDYCRKNMNNDLVDQICSFDPVDENVRVDNYLLSLYFKRITGREVWKSGSLVVYYLYHWAYTAFCIIQLKSKLKSFYRPPSVCHLAST
ncbi:EF-hand calcium-binding domain-containing protein 5-like [Chiloscyllium plagiosum]|uniref:EF-hand calcium-binding domain-containing protein 5-like n=1 Tax=Chiloscyllium plagiosum TaxID=36176 RepID=UPI001CB8050E|nr:EF-hand calcium-binding domain-containing protein 5-like [Chiloscyllium plagiosum]